jgi:hypothetical protein
MKEKYRKKKKDAVFDKIHISSPKGLVITILEKQRDG